MQYATISELNRKNRKQEMEEIEWLLSLINNVLEPLGRRMVFEDGTNYPINGEVVHLVKTEVLVKTMGTSTDLKPTLESREWSTDVVPRGGSIVHGSLPFIITSLSNIIGLLNTVHSKKNATMVKKATRIPGIK